MSGRTISIYLSLGSNLGDRRSNIAAAVQALDKALGQPHSAMSAIIETPSWGFEAPAFLNCALRYDFTGTKPPTPAALLDICKTVERGLGREESLEFDDQGRRIYHSRTIDVDILLFGRRHVTTSRLTIPHPLIAERRFVLVPLREIADEFTKNAFPEYFHD